MRGRGTRRGGSRARSALTLTLALTALLTACSGPTRTPSGAPPGTTHARPRGAPADPDARRRALEGASKSGAVLRAADRLEESGAALEDEERRRVMRAVDALAARELERHWNELGGPGMARSAVALRAARWALHRGDDAEALAWIGRIRGDAEIADAGAALKAEILDSREVAGQRVAVVLPLSGRYASLGKEIRRGVELAAAERDVELVFVDTGGEPRGAAAAVDEAARGHRAAAILGPVGRNEAAAGARRAVARGIPIALLSPSVAGGSAGAGVVRLWSSAAWEGRQAAVLAAELRYERAGILAPRDGAGEARARAFSEEAEARGIEIVRRGRYDPTAGDLEPDVRAFFGLDPAENDALRRHLRRRGSEGWKSFVPELDMELVYIPDRHERAALVASFFPYFNVEVRTDPFMDVRSLRHKYGEMPSVVQLFGSAGWRDPSLIARGGRAVQGALIAGVCRDEAALGEQGRAFFSAFESRHGRAPGEVAAQAFDAARAVFDARRYAARQQSGHLRRDLGRALSRMTIEEGACGPGRVEDGELVREAPIYEVTADEIEPYRY